MPSIKKIETLCEQVFHICKWMESFHGTAPFGMPAVEIVRNLGVDGEAVPGKIYLDNRILESDTNFIQLTVAHEVAHQWWGLFCKSSHLPSEAMAETMALGWLHATQPDVAKDFRRIARGRMFYGFLIERQFAEEAEIFGRLPLMLFDCWQCLTTDFLKSIRSALSGDLSHNQATEYISKWLQKPTRFPIPSIRDGRLIDRNNTALPYRVSVTFPEYSTYYCSESREQPMPKKAKISPAQFGPIGVGNIASDIEYFLQRTSGE